MAWYSRGGHPQTLTKPHSHNSEGPVSEEVTVHAQGMVVVQEREGIGSRAKFQEAVDHKVTRVTFSHKTGKQLLGG